MCGLREWAHGITGASPEWVGSVARGIAFFPVMMSVYAVFYAAWWPFA